MFYLEPKLSTFLGNDDAPFHFSSLLSNNADRHGYDLPISSASQPRKGPFHLFSVFPTPYSDSR